MEQNNKGNSFNYFAFISYSRADEGWAKWLQKKIEQYRLPTVLVREDKSLPKKINPIFRDKTDLTTGQLTAALHTELDLSKKLIIICSASSARSEWVNKEAQRFINSGRISDIIPVIVSGTPNSADENECFPEALRLPEEEQLLGVSIPEIGKNNAFLRVVAGMLEVKFDQLKRRHEQRRKRRNAVIAAASLVFLAASAFGGYKAWDYYAPHETYYADYALRWGAPEGICELSAKEIASREVHYTFIRQRGAIRKVIQANSSGTPVEILEDEFTDRPMISVFYYREDGRVEYVEYVDNNDKVLTTQVYTTDLKAVDFQVSMLDSSIRTLTSSTTSKTTGMFDLDITALSSSRSDIGRHALEYNSDGYVTKIIYMRDRRTPILDADGIGGVEYTPDSEGRPVEIRYLGLNANSYAATKKNIAGKRYYYDEFANRTRVEYFDPEGILCYNAEGWSVLEYTFDEKGNNVSKAFFGADTLPVQTNNGYAYSILEYDEKGNYIGIEFFNVNGERARHKDGPAIIKKEYDKNGRIISQAFFDENGEPALHSNGNALEKFSYDNNGNYTKGEFFGTDYQPMLNFGGYACVEMEYDRRGNRTKESYFDEGGKPVLCGDGYASYSAEYDSKDNNTGISYFGTDGELVINGFGFACRENEFDDRGNLIRADYFGPDMKPVAADNGIASVVYEYDDGGNISSHRYFGTDGKPTLNSSGYASISALYDTRGNPVEIALFDAGGNPVLGSDGYSVVRSEYDERGNAFSLSFFGTDSQPVTVNGGYAAMRSEYDGRDNITKSIYLGTNGKPIVSDEGYSAVVFTYDLYGNPVSILYLGADGEPVDRLEGYSSLNAEYDEKGEITGVFYRNVKGDILTKHAIKILSVPDENAAGQEGMRAGDFLIRYGDWFYTELDPEDYPVMYISFLQQVIGTWGEENIVTIYNPSADACFEYLLEPFFNFEFSDEFWISDEDYAQIKNADDVFVLSRR